MKIRMFVPLAAALVIAGAASLAGFSAQAAEKAKCVVSGKEIEVTEKTPRVSVQGKTQYFCCENCPKAFLKEPERFVKGALACPVVGGAAKAGAAERLVVNNGVWYVCCNGCKDGAPAAAPVLKNLRDVVSGKTFTATDVSPRSDHKDQIYYFENKETKAAFDKEPAKYAWIYAK